MTLLLDKTPIALSVSAVGQPSDEFTYAAPSCKLVPTVVMNTTLSRVLVFEMLFSLVLVS